MPMEQASLQYARPTEIRMIKGPVHSEFQITYSSDASTSIKNVNQFIAYQTEADLLASLQIEKQLID
jgi:hypothetical protein